MNASAHLPITKPRDAGLFRTPQRCTEQPIFRGKGAHGRNCPYEHKALRRFRTQFRLDNIGLEKDCYPAQKLRRIKQRRRRLSENDFCPAVGRRQHRIRLDVGIAGAQTFAVCGALPHTRFFLNFLITLPFSPGYSLSFKVLCVAE